MCQRSYSQQGQGDIDTGVKAGICSSGIYFWSPMVEEDEVRLRGVQKEQREYSVNGRDGTMWAFFPSTSLSLSPQLLFQQLGPCPALLAKPAVGSVAQGTPAPLQPPLSTAHFPIAVTRKFCNRSGKGGGPVDNLSMHIQPSHSKK